MAKTPTAKIVSKKHLARLERERIQNRNIMIVGIAVLVLVLATVGYGILDQTVLSARRPVAKVANEVITTHEWQVRTRFARTQLINQYNQTAQIASFFGNDPNSGSYFQSQLSQLSSQLSDPSGLASQVLTEMIDEVVIKQEAKKLGITVSAAEIDDAMKTAFGYYPNGTPTPTVTASPFLTPTLNPTQLAIITITPTPTTAPTETPAPSSTPGGATATVEPTVPATPSGPTPTLAPSATPTQYTLAGYQKVVGDYLTTMKSIGLTDQEMRSIFEVQIFRQKMVELKTKDLKPEQDEVWARHILVPDIASAQAVLERLKKGEDFGKIASEVSIDTSNKDKGGDLGWFPHSAMIKEFADEAFKLKVGEISQPVKTTEGFHVIQVLGHEVRPLTSSEFSQYKNQTFQDWLTSTKKGLTITTYDSVWKAAVPTEPVFTPNSAAPIGQ
ncbi:MAG: peptidylprolyl isomerase [Anaerolineaceae bacterium]|nr:peptidylprolyl isomerase [Anaerolineaceae bacterium]